ncbi:MAG: LrgB family protein [Eubacterium sp.]|nr:LrgB family protein [Eubacterium sp.]
MRDFLTSSVFMAVTISLLGYEMGSFLKRKTGLAILNPLLVAIAVVIVLLLLFHVDYEVYEEGSEILSYLLTPATVALAVPLYRQMHLLKKNGVAICAGVLAGVVTSLASTLLIAVVFQMTHEEYVTFLPKSITTAIGMGMSEEMGGIVTITVAVIVVTGIVGNVMGEWVCRIFHIRERIAVGLALGTSAHVIGTTKAMELGDVEGAMSSLAIVLAGILTVLGANVFAAMW